jgi:hypothetical protein
MLETKPFSRLEVISASFPQELQGLQMVLHVTMRAFVFISPPSVLKIVSKFQNYNFGFKLPTL